MNIRTRMKPIMTMKRGKGTLKSGLILVLLVFFLVFPFVWVKASSPSAALIIRIKDTDWAWRKTSINTMADRLVIDVGGGKMYGSLSNATGIVSGSLEILDSNGVGELYREGKVDELILGTFPRWFIVTTWGGSFTDKTNEWLYAAVAWAHETGYKEVSGFGYSAGSALWLRYALGDSYGHMWTQPNQTLTSAILKAYANETCTVCWMQATNYKVPLLFLAGLNDATSKWNATLAFYNRLPQNLTRTMLLYPYTHNEMAFIPTSDFEGWLDDPQAFATTHPAFTPLPETSTPTLILIAMVLATSMIATKGKKET